MTKFFLLTLTFLLLLPLSARASDEKFENIRIPQQVTNFLSEPVLVPGSPFYGLKRWVENVGDWLTWDKVKQTRRDLEKARQRLSEANVLLKQGRVKQASDLMKDYKARMEHGAKAAKKIKDNEKLTQVLGDAEKITKNYNQYLEVVVSKVPEDYQQEFKEAFAVTDNWRLFALELVQALLEKMNQVGENIKNTGVLIQEVERELEMKLEQEMNQKR